MTFGDRSTTKARIRPVKAGYKVSYGLMSATFKTYKEALERATFWENIYKEFAERA